jgi:GcrA cell cycle regulator
MFANKPTWTDQRIALLKQGFEAGLSCREIAGALGVTRNAVIGKLSRLQLTRDKGDDAPRAKRESRPRSRGPRLVGAPRLLRAMRDVALPACDEPPIHNGHCCSLLELDQDRCHWPISTPGAPDFRYCGNAAVRGLSYCPGHVRIAYRAGSSARRA